MMYSKILLIFLSLVVTPPLIFSKNLDISLISFCKISISFLLFSSLAIIIINCKSLTILSKSVINC
ncbi:hypothetical protein GLOIN_2v1636007 [Rhizophagus irregularis DAOM 181602=DAOM 197198]|uniref:Uncharacterized protein n=1 Tax=Rhizophagus irregularis (strain DAOM 181602 / DAOM 197198 / MUCL 43194) TaxID=747089 RepID=A0A2P4PT03_RHIID|nr:hypothetical protein GLOIN_2v1636007 [Rhizophagus irregularis DAOM 181602=DAOM 197198]POG68507.1 hypothetical protein GLOIN_2v1636007 [Rhizophagus irregularis DAOM 181602=DAOM 197198]|eukprot:XP_025175373.1 hypothetical protein GLOIN_2v1636007 [Rhizophagus irregularis DAOM 181602=DAOM 197198]